MKFNLWKVFCHDVKIAWNKFLHDGIALVIAGLWLMLVYLYRMTLGALYSVYVCHRANKEHPPTDEKFWKTVATHSSSEMEIPVDKSSQS